MNRPWRAVAAAFALTLSGCLLKTAAPLLLFAFAGPAAWDPQGVCTLPDDGGGWSCPDGGGPPQNPE